VTTHTGSRGLLRSLSRRTGLAGRRHPRHTTTWPNLETLESRVLLSVTPAAFLQGPPLDHQHTITLPVTSAGSTMATARNLGALASTTITGFVGTSNLNDYYVFTVSARSTFSLSLTGLSADADVELLQDRYGDKIRHPADLLAISQNWGIANESITASLSAGTYYAHVYRYSGNTNYALSLRASALNPAPAPAPTPTPPHPPTPSNAAPTIAQPASATLTTVTGKNTTLSVLGADDGGANNLTYTWTDTTANGAAPSFSINGTNAARTTVVTFTKAGTYIFTATIRDAGGLTVSSSITITVGQTLTNLTVTPGSANLVINATQQFTASTLDQFGNAMATAPALTWSTTLGTITTAGKLTTPSIAGTGTVKVQAGSLSATSSLIVTTASNFLNLKTPALASLTQQLDADGSISRADMIQILRATENDGVVDSNEILDLRTILSNRATLSITDSVCVLASDIVNGNTANAQYQGAALGNLYVNSPATQMEKLIDKWFLGADHPSAGSYSYRSVSGSLFVSGPAYTDIAQGQLGDCYLVATLGSIAQHYASNIQSMFTDNGDGTFTVRFYANGTADYVTVDRMLPTTSSGYAAYASFGGSATNTGNELWVALAEKAYAQWNETGKTQRGNNVNTFAAIEGGWMADVDAQVLGRAAPAYNTSSSNLQTLINALNSGKAVTAGSQSSSPGNGVYANHAYIITGYNASNGTFTFYNPWGIDSPAPLTYAQVMQSFTAFVVA
jgi:hypothetical protein